MQQWGDAKRLGWSYVDLILPWLLRMGIELGGGGGGGRGVKGGGGISRGHTVMYDMCMLIGE